VQKFAAKPVQGQVRGSERCFGALKAQGISAQGKRSAALGNSKRACALKGRW